MNRLKTINIIGCGKVGQTLGRLWTANQTLVIQDVLNQSLESGQRAISFMQAGRAVESWNALRPADIVMISTPDIQIRPIANALARSTTLHAGTVVFHCSGALRAAELQAVTAQGALIASVHPIRSFATPEQAVSDFAGTFCGIEGDTSALDILTAVFSAIGGRTVEIDAEFKTVYHAAAVFASNYLVTLLDVAMQAYVKAGIAPEESLQLMEPLVRGTVDNIFRLGPTKALTGPIARGDIATAVTQYRAVKAWDEHYGALYKQFGKLTADIAARRMTMPAKDEA